MGAHRVAEHHPARVSYASNGYNAVLLQQHAQTGALEFWVAGAGAWVAAPTTAINDGEWHHIAISWTRTNGETLLYKDGELADRIVGHAAGGSIGLNGYLVLGQDQDCYAGCFDPEETLRGSLAQFALFDRVLPPAAVKDLYSSITCGEGLTCDGVDDDRDGIADDHLLGTRSCAAASCAELIASESFSGADLYWTDPFGKGPVLEECAP